MPRTSHRIARLAAGLTVVAATSAASLLTAGTAQAATPVIVSKLSATTMKINGSDVGESIRVGTLNGFTTVSNSLGSVQAGAGCVQLGGTVRCDNVSFVVYSGNSGDDSFRNDTALRVNAAGGAGSDRLTGGSNSDRLRGDGGVDVVNGGTGSDTCDAESESACEADIPPPPRIRIPT